MPDWDARYAEKEYAYGTEPNAFLSAVAPQIPAGPVLCLAEGQGRNAVYLASLGHRVVAVDQSRVGLARARELARSRGVTIETVVADLADYSIEPDAWAGIVSIFGHLPRALRQRVHRAAARGLRPGGLFVLEAYTKRQLEYASGGPRDADLLVSLEDLRGDLSSLALEIAREVEREVVEGRLHSGLAAVVQIAARKPAAA